MSVRKSVLVEKRLPLRDHAYVYQSIEGFEIDRDTG